MIHNILRLVDIVWLCSKSLPLPWTWVMQLEGIMRLEFRCYLQSTFLPSLLYNEEEMPYPQTKNIMEIWYVFSLRIPKMYLHRIHYPV